MHVILTTGHTRIVAILSYSALGGDFVRMKVSEAVKIARLSETLHYVSVHPR